MKNGLMAIITLCLLSGPSYASGISGAWNVVSEATYEHNCKHADPGATQAYVWLISSNKEGALSISVQGETSFKKLRGVWLEKDSMAIIEGRSTAALSSANSWFKLVRAEKDKLVGIRRYIGAQGSIYDSTAPCFADFKITATKQ